MIGPLLMVAAQALTLDAQGMAKVTDIATVACPATNAQSIDGTDMVEQLRAVSATARLTRVEQLMLLQLCSLYLKGRTDAMIER